MSTIVSNLALSHLGNSNEIADVTTERSQEARACRAFLDISRDETLRDAALPTTRKTVTLALVTDDPTAEFRYSYRYPTDCLAVRGVVMDSVVRYYSPQLMSRLYVMAADDDGPLIKSNFADMGIEYIARITDPNFLPPDFRMAWSFKLAFYIAPRVTAGDPFKLGDRAANAYIEWIDKCKANAYNEESSIKAPASDLVTAHVYSDPYGGYPISGRNDNP